MANIAIIGRSIQIYQLVLSVCQPSLSYPVSSPDTTDSSRIPVPGLYEFDPFGAGILGHQLRANGAKVAGYAPTRAHQTRGTHAMAFAYESRVFQYNLWVVIQKLYFNF